MVATVQKRISGRDLRSYEYWQAAAAGEEEALTRIAARAWQDESDDPGAEPPPVEFDDCGRRAPSTEPWSVPEAPTWCWKSRQKWRRTLLDASSSGSCARWAARAAYGIARGPDSTRRRNGSTCWDPPDLRASSSNDRRMVTKLDDQDALTAGIFGDFEYVRPQTQPEVRPWASHANSSSGAMVSLAPALYEKREPRAIAGYLGLPGTDLLVVRYRARAALPCRASADVRAHSASPTQEATPTHGPPDARCWDEQRARHGRCARSEKFEEALAHRDRRFDRISNSAADPFVMINRRTCDAATAARRQTEDRAALPRRDFIGFTGTPIDQWLRSSPR